MIEAKSLKTERLPAARGIITPQPEFTWALAADRDGERQSACEIEVDRVAPDGGISPVWRSGKLPRLIGDEVRYGGEPLATRSDYRWRVRVWDRDDRPCGWSPWTTFETGVMAPDAIRAPWIFGGGALRRRFAVAAGLQRARAYVTGIGYYEFFCNGRKVSAAALAPSFTEFNKRIEYEIIDLTPVLREGGNCVGFLLGDGFWRHGGPVVLSRANQALTEIVLEYTGGRREVISTADAWQASPGPFLPESAGEALQLWNGVALDLGWLARGWCQPGGTDAGWTPARLAGPEQCADTTASRCAPTGRNGQLVPTLLPPIREVETLKPVTVKRLSDTLLALDFGQNFTGWVRFRATAKAGTRLVARHTEDLHPDGRLNPYTLSGAKQMDTFQLAGTPGEIVEPRFVYHGFRYAEIEGPVAAIAPGSIEGVVVHTALEPVGAVTTSDDRINWLLDAVKWTVRSNAMSIMTDNCQRGERRGYTSEGAGGTALQAGRLFYDMGTLARKWVEDIIDIQREDGSFLSCAAPSNWLDMAPMSDRAIAITPMAIYESSGDRALLAHAFPHMRRYVDYMLANLRDDLLPDDFRKGAHCEWLCIGKQNDPLGDNAMAVDTLRLVARAAAVLGESGERYTAAADRLAAAAHQRWGRKNGNFGDLLKDAAGWVTGAGFAQSNQVYALYFGLAAPEIRQAVFEKLVMDLVEQRGESPFITTGVTSSHFLPLVLSEYGRDDIVWRWLHRDEYPGYGFMQRCGATAIWEAWEILNGCHNHTGLTGIGTWLMQYLVGIRVEPGPEPLFRLRPAVHLPLASLTARWQSRWGEVEVSWATGDEGKQLTVSIPPGCRGKLDLAGSGKTQELGSGRHLLLGQGGCGSV